jgi:hypothetical protein
MFLAAVLCAAFTLPVFAADVAGKWKAESKRPDGEVMTSTYDFKVEGETLTGTMSGRMGDRPISDGKVKGDEISFIMKFERDGQEFKMIYKGKVEGDDLKLNMSSANGEFTRDIVAKRVK